MAAAGAPAGDVPVPAWSPPPLRVSDMPGFDPADEPTASRYAFLGVMALQLRLAPDAATHARWLQAARDASRVYSALAGGRVRLHDVPALFADARGRLAAAGLGLLAPNGYMALGEAAICQDNGAEAAAEPLLRTSTRILSAADPASVADSCAIAHLRLASVLYKGWRFVEGLAEADAANAALEAAEAHCAAAIASVGLVLEGPALAAKITSLRAGCMGQCGQREALLSLLPRVDALLQELRASPPGSDERHVVCHLLYETANALAKLNAVHEAAPYARQLLELDAGPANTAVACCTVGGMLLSATSPPTGSAGVLDLAIDMLRAGLSAGEQQLRVVGVEFLRGTDSWLSGGLNLAGALRAAGRLQEAEATLKRHWKLLRPFAALLHAIPGAMHVYLTIQELEGLPASRWPHLAVRRTTNGPSAQASCNAPGCSRITQPDGAPLLLCVGCRTVAYCSAACQKADWKPRHKALCKALAAKSAERLTGAE